MGHLEIASPFMFVYLFLYLSLSLSLLRPTFVTADGDASANANCARFRRPISRVVSHVEPRDQTNRRHDGWTGRVTMP